MTQDDETDEDLAEIEYVFHPKPMVRFLDDGSKITGGNENPMARSAMREQGTSCPVDPKHDQLSNIAHPHYEAARQAIRSLQSLRKIGSATAAAYEVLLLQDSILQLTEAQCSESEDPHALLDALQSNMDTWPAIHNAFAKFHPDNAVAVQEYLSRTASAHGFNFKTKSPMALQRGSVVLSLFRQVNRVRTTPFLKGESWEEEAQDLPALHKTAAIIKLWCDVICKMLEARNGENWQECFIARHNEPLVHQEVIRWSRIVEQASADSKNPVPSFSRTQVRKVFRETLNSFVGNSDSDRKK